MLEIGRKLPFSDIAFCRDFPTLATVGFALLHISATTQSGLQTRYDSALETTTAIVILPCCS